MFYLSFQSRYGGQGKTQEKKKDIPKKIRDEECGDAFSDFSQAIVYLYDVIEKQEARNKEKERDGNIGESGHE